MSTEYIALVASLVSAAVALFALFYARSRTQAAKQSVDTLVHEYQDDHEYRRRLAAAQLIRDWDEHVFPSRSIVLARWPDRFNAANPIPWADIVAERDRMVAEHCELMKKVGATGAKYPDDMLTITDHMTKILNYFELVAHSVFCGIADEDIIKTFLRNPFHKWYGLLEDFRDNVTRQRKYDPWPPVTELYRRWYPEPQSSVARRRTGVLDAHQRSL
jgi:hypothetical protein